MKEAPTPSQFVEALEVNEDAMPEMAAMAATCEQFGISEEDGYDLLLEYERRNVPCHLTELG